jgi:hypothetical protein
MVFLFFLFSTPFKSTALVGKSRGRSEDKEICNGKRKKKKKKLVELRQR